MGRTSTAVTINLMVAMLLLGGGTIVTALAVLNGHQESFDFSVTLYAGDGEYRLGFGSTHELISAKLGGEEWPEYKNLVIQGEFKAFRDAKVVVGYGMSVDGLFIYLDPGVSGLPKTVPVIKHGGLSGETVGFFIPAKTYSLEKGKTYRINVSIPRSWLENIWNSPFFSPGKVTDDGIYELTFWLCAWDPSTREAVSTVEQVCSLTITDDMRVLGAVRSGTFLEELRGRTYVCSTEYFSVSVTAYKGSILFGIKGKKDFPIKQETTLVYKDQSDGRDVGTLVKDVPLTRTFSVIELKNSGINPTDFNSFRLVIRLSKLDGSLIGTWNVTIPEEIASYAFSSGAQLPTFVEWNPPPRGYSHERGTPGKPIKGGYRYFLRKYFASKGYSPKDVTKAVMKFEADWGFPVNGKVVIDYNKARELGFSVQELRKAKKWLWITPNGKSMLLVADPYEDKVLYLGPLERSPFKRVRGFSIFDLRFRVPIPITHEVFAHDMYMATSFSLPVSFVLGIILIVVGVWLITGGSIGWLKTFLLFLVVFMGVIFLLAGGAR